MMMLSQFVWLANPKSITIADIAPHATWGENKSVELKGAYPQVNSTPGEWRDGSYGKDYFAGAYRMGYGAGCEYLTPPQSYWCQPLGRVTRTIIAARILGCVFQRSSKSCGQVAGDTYYAGIRPRGVVRN